MDPNETLRQIRDLVDHIRQLSDTETEDVDTVLALNGVALASYVRALDEWLSRGGFLPQPWIEGRRRSIQEYKDRARQQMLDAGEDPDREVFTQTVPGERKASRRGGEETRELRARGWIGSWIGSIQDGPPDLSERGFDVLIPDDVAGPLLRALGESYGLTNEERKRARDWVDAHRRDAEDMGG